MCSACKCVRAYVRACVLLDGYSWVCLGCCCCSRAGASPALWCVRAVRFDRASCLCWTTDMFCVCSSCGEVLVVCTGVLCIVALNAWLGAGCQGEWCLLVGWSACVVVCSVVQWLCAWHCGCTQALCGCSVWVGLVVCGVSVGIVRCGLWSIAPTASSGMSALGMTSVLLQCHVVMLPCFAVISVVRSFGAVLFCVSCRRAVLFGWRF